MTTTMLKTDFNESDFYAEEDKITAINIDSSLKFFSFFLFQDLNFDYYSFHSLRTLENSLISYSTYFNIAYEWIDKILISYNKNTDLCDLVRKKKELLLDYQSQLLKMESNVFSLLEKKSNAK